VAPFASRPARDKLIGNMSRPKGARRAEFPATLLLLGILLAINAIAGAAVFLARRGVQEEAARALVLQTTIDARSVEAALADLRTDLVFVARSPAFARAVLGATAADPVARRWSRLDVETTLLLFLEGQSALDEIVVRGANGEVRHRVGRTGGAPVVLPAVDGGDEPGGPRLRLDVGEPAATGTMLEASLRPAALLAATAPGVAQRLELRTAPPAASASTPLRAEVPIEVRGWEPDVTWSLARHEEGSPLLLSVERLAGRFQLTVLLNLVTVVLVLVLGAFALRQMRRSVRLAAEREQQERMRALERHLARNQRLASVGRLAAGLAHEINNPLEGMANYLEMLEEDLESGDQEAAREQASRIRQGLDRATGVMRRVLQFSQPRGEPRESVDVGAVLAETVVFARDLKAFDGVSLEMAPANGPLAVQGDSAGLGQLFLNLVLNAAQVQEGGGSVEVEARAEADGVMVRVLDRGPGVPPEIRDRLFEPFFSARGSTGLGLSVCHGIVRDHGGTLEARAREGGGSVFEVWLPTASGARPPAVLMGGEA
jgi:signal transduction histidine kinase